MDELPIYRFKKDAPDYQEKRHKHLIELTKNRYKNDEIYRNKIKENAKKKYERLKEALQFFESSNKE